MHTSRTSTARFGRLLLIVALVLTGLISSTQIAHAATLLVDRNDDTAGLPCTAAANDCSLRSAVEIANANGAVADQISFAAGYTINLAGTLHLNADNTTISGLVGSAVKINGANITPSNITPGNVFRISGSGVKLENLFIYGAKAVWSNIWITGTAQRVIIADNDIGDDDKAFGGCGQSPESYGGIYINSDGAIESGSARAWIYGNVIECNQGTPGDLNNPGDGITIVGSDLVVIGVDELGVSSPNERNNIENNRGNGVTVSGAVSTNRIYNSVIQTSGNSGVYLDNAQSTIIARAFIQANGNSGVELVNGTRNTRIGAPNGEGNLIVENGREGIYISDSGTETNFILGNKIGIDSTGTIARGNGRNGIVITNGADTNFIGNTENERNIISGNGHSGIVIDGAANNNAVQGNYIGTNAAGTAAIPNGTLGSIHAQRAGIAIVGSADNNAVGGTTPTNRNLISGNRGTGVFIGDAGTSDNLVQGNYIGTNAAGAGELGNGDAGIALIGAAINTLGVGTQDNPQYIGGNGREGIYIENTNGTQIRSSNFVGSSLFGGVPGNGREGILVNNASNTTIVPYSVMSNGRAGIAIVGAGSAGNRIVFTENRGNGGLAIDLGNNGPTPNDPGDTDSGPNALMNYPVITSVSSTTISGTACAGCAVVIYRADGPTGSAFGGGGLIVGTTASAAGNWSVAIPAGYTRLTLTAFATDPSGNTSEMTPRPQIYIPLSQK